LVGANQATLHTRFDDRLTRRAEGARQIEFAGGQIEGNDAELENLRRRVLGKSRGLEVDDRDGAALL
jgi:hypothetical protein